MGEYLDKVLALARTRDYERVEHGRVEHVSGYARLESAHRALTAAYQKSWPYPDDWGQVAGHLHEAEEHLQHAGVMDSPEAMLHMHMAHQAAAGQGRKRGKVLAPAERSSGVRASADALRGLLEQHMHGGERRLAPVDAGGGSRMPGKRPGVVMDSSQLRRRDHAQAELDRLRAKQESGRFLMPHEVARRGNMQRIVEGRG